MQHKVLQCGNHPACTNHIPRELVALVNLLCQGLGVVPHRMAHVLARVSSVKCVLGTS